MNSQGKSHHQLLYFCKYPLVIKNHFRLLRLLVSNIFGRKRVSGQSDKLVICIKNIFTVQTRRQPTPMPFCRVDFPRFLITRRFSCCCTNRTRFGSLHYMAATTSYYVMLLFAICIKSGSCRFDRGEYPFLGKVNKQRLQSKAFNQVPLCQTPPRLPSSSGKSLPLLPRAEIQS